MIQSDKTVLFEIYNILFDSFGPQQWWPAEARFEVIVGAILTQNTNWNNVEKALCNLKKEKILSAKGLKSISTPRLAALIKPAGYYNVKAKRLKNFISFLFNNYNGRISLMMKEPLPVLRKALLGVNGIGPETADSILLYSCEKPIFVVDAYTKRILSRHKIVSSDASYHIIQELLMKNLDHDVQMFNEYHALIVAAGKNYCKTTPLCDKCPLRNI